MKPPDDSTRFLGTPLVRSGDQGLLVRGLAVAVRTVLRGLRALVR